MIIPFGLLAAAQARADVNLVQIWSMSTLEGKLVIVVLVSFSMVAWSVMISKSLQMRRAEKFNLHFGNEFHSQKNVLGIFDRKLQVDDIFVVGQHQ